MKEKTIVIGNFNYLILRFLTKEIVLCVFTMLVFLQQSIGQTGQILQFKNIVKPAPESSKFVNYFLTPISTSTGTSSIDIPIYNIDVDGFHIPISISYHNSGIKVDDISGSVGLGWSLNAGGGVYRNINGQPDDRENVAGFLYNQTSQSFVDGINNNLCSYEGNYLPAIAENRFDISQDSYYYNFITSNGSLYLNSSRDFKEARNRNFVFNYNKSTINTANKAEIDFFDVRDKDGNYFSFADKEVSNTYNRTTPIGNPPSVSVIGTTAWKLTSVMTPSRKKINFYYADYPLSYNYVTGHNYTKRPPYNSEFFNNCGRGPNEFSTTTTSFSTNNKLISKIVTSHLIIDFYYSDNAALEIWKRKLDRIVISKASTGELVRSVDLTYSAFQGNLTETMGTGLVTTGNTRLRLDKVILRDKNQVSVQTYSFKYNEGVLPKIGSFAKDQFGYYNGVLSNTSLLYANILNVNNSNVKANRTVRSPFITYGVLQEISYPTGGKKRFTYGANEEGGVYSPGLRVEKIETINELGNIINSKTFEYSMIKGLKTAFPCESIGQFGRYDDRLVTMIPDIFIYSSGYTFLSNIGTPKNFYYGKAITREKGVDGRDLVTVENYGESQYIPYNGFSSYTEYNGEYQPDLHSVQYFKGNNISENLIKEHTYTYKSFGDSNDDNVRYKGIPGKLASGITCPEGITGCYNFYEGVEVDQFLSSVWTVLDSEEERDYTSGVLANAKKTNYVYDNPKHYFPSKIVNFNSDESVTEYRRKYVYDFVSDFPYNEMVLINQISPLIEEKIVKNNNELSLRRTNYFKPYSNFDIYVPKTVEARNGSNPLEIRLSYYNYDQWGHPTSIGKTNGAKINYVWSYGGSYPIAEIKNLDYAVIEDILGGSVAVRTFAIKANPTIDELNNFLLPLKLALPLAEISFYVYDPVAGMISQTDPKGQITYYEYDDFQRLKNIKDQNQNIINNIKYNYNPLGNSTFPNVYGNDLKTKSFQKICPLGQIGSSVIYTVPADTYMSGDKNESNNRALADINLNGQNYANQYGTCTPSP